jgi:hypothetical protein
VDADPRRGTSTGFGVHRWLFVGSLCAIGAYGLLLLIALVDPQPDNLAALVVAPILVLLTVPIATRIARADGDPAIVTLIVIAVALKLAASLLRYYTAIDLYGGLADAAKYHEAGAIFAPAIRSLHFDAVTTQSKIPGTGFIEVVTGVVYAITGVSRLAGFFVFAWFGVLGQILCWRAFKIAVPDGDSKRYALLVLFFPTLLYWPSSIGKEGWILLTLGLSAYGVARLLRRRPLGITLAVIGVTGVTMVRPHIALVILASLLTALIVGRTQSRSPLAPVIRMASIVVVLAVTLVVVSQAETFFNIERFDQDTVQSTLTSAENSTAQGGSSFTPVAVNSPLDLPLATVTVLFRPFPFEANNVQMLATAGEGMFLFVLCLTSWRRLATVPRRLRSTPYVAFALVFVLLFVWAFSSFGNFGILARQRSQMLPFLFVLLALPAAVPGRRRPQAMEPRSTTPDGPRRFDRWAWVRSVRTT